MQLAWTCFLVRCHWKLSMYGWVVCNIFVTLSLITDLYLHLKLKEQWVVLQLYEQLAALVLYNVYCGQVYFGVLLLLVTSVPKVQKVHVTYACTSFCLSVSPSVHQLSVWCAIPLTQVNFNPSNPRKDLQNILQNTMFYVNTYIQVVGKICFSYDFLWSSRSRLP